MNKSKKKPIKTYSLNEIKDELIGKVGTLVRDKYEQQIEDLFDVIIAESREDEDSIPLEHVIKSIKSKRKLA